MFLLIILYFVFYRDDVGVKTEPVVNIVAVPEITTPSPPSVSTPPSSSKAPPPSPPLPPPVLPPGMPLLQQAIVKSGCEVCTDNIYGKDCTSKLDGITYTCVAGSWHNFTRKKSEIPLMETISQNPLYAIVPEFSKTTQISVFVVCADGLCQSNLTASRVWKNAQQVIDEISKIDPNFKSKVTPASEQDFLSFASGTTLEGVIDSTGIVMRKDGNVPRKLQFPSSAKGYWFVGPKPNPEWISFINSKGYGISS